MAIDEGLDLTGISRGFWLPPFGNKFSDHAPVLAISKAMVVFREDKRIIDFIASSILIYKEEQ
jgi:hypothetical protein